MATPQGVHSHITIHSGHTFGNVLAQFVINACPKVVKRQFLQHLQIEATPSKGTSNLCTWRHFPSTCPPNPYYSFHKSFCVPMVSLQMSQKVEPNGLYSHHGLVFAILKTCLNLSNIQLSSQWIFTKWAAIRLNLKQELIMEVHTWVIFINHIDNLWQNWCGDRRNVTVAVTNRPRDIKIFCFIFPRNDFLYITLKTRSPCR